MRSIAYIGMLSFIFLNCIACKKVDKSVDQNFYSEENHPVRELFISSIEAFNERNLELFLSNFASEIRMFGTDGNYFGQSALRERFGILFKQFPNMKMEIPELKLDILSREVVLVNFQWKLYPMGQGPAFSGIGSGIYKFEDGQWKEILEVERTTEVDEALRQE